MHPKYLTSDGLLINSQGVCILAVECQIYFFCYPKDRWVPKLHTHVYIIYSNKPVFSRQTDQTDCTVNSGICNQFFLYHWLRNKMTNLTFSNCLTIDLSRIILAVKMVRAELEMECVLTKVGN